MYKFENEELKALEEVILLYANTSPFPVSNLRAIPDALMNEPYSDPETFNLDRFNVEDHRRTLPEVDFSNKIFDRFISPHISIDRICFLIDITIKVQDLGLNEAREIFADINRKDQFLLDTCGFHPRDLPSTVKYNRKMFDTAYYEVYGYTVASSCPCRPEKRSLLEKSGFLLAGPYRDDFIVDEGQVVSAEMYREPRWIKERPNCLQCDHIQFVAILNNLSTGRYESAFKYMGEMVSGYGRDCRSEEAGFWHDQKASCFGMGKRMWGSGAYRENPGAFPTFLNGLPCNVLVDFLSSDFVNAKRIKKCTLCKKFYISNTTRESHFCSRKCRQDFHNKRNTESGKAAAYKKQGRDEGKYQ